ncbi:MAG: hypothetical protein ABI625_11830 [bacterium]
MTTPSDSAERAIWGLVADRYDVAAHTPSLTSEQAFQLSHAADMGDPSAPLDDAVAFLDTPTWGAVFARYYTNAQSDSAKRFTIVYDVVRPSPSQLQSAQQNAFRIFPTLPPSRSIEQTGELDAPTINTAADEGARVRVLLDTEDGTTLNDVLAAILADGPTLWISKTSAIRTVEAIVLMLPPELRSRFTFQTYTLNASAHQPRLTIADQHLSAPKQGKWSIVLPRDRAQLSERARTAARSLTALAQDTARYERVRRVFATQLAGSEPEEDGLLGEIERLLRLEEFNARRDASDASNCLRLIASATSERERSYMTTELALTVDAPVIAEGATDVVEREGETGWRGVRYVATNLLPRSATASVERDVLKALAANIAQIQSLPDTPEARAARTVLAVFAARSGLADALIALAPESADAPTLDAIGGRDAVVQQTATELQQLARIVFGDAPATVANATTLLSVLRNARSRLTMKRSTKRASAMGFGAIRRVLASSASTPTATEMATLLTSLKEFWKMFAPDGELERAVHALLLGMDESQAKAEGAQAAALLLSAPVPVNTAELVGWARLVFAREDAPVAARARVASLLENGKALPQLSQAIAPLLRSVPGASGRAILEPDWLRILRLADAATIGAFLVDALAASIDATVEGGDVGPVTDACVALADQDILLTTSLGAPVLQALSRLRARGNHASAALRLRVCCAAVESVSDADVADRIATDIWGADARDGVIAGRFWLIASALRLTDRIRPYREVEQLKASARSNNEWQRLPTVLVDVLSQFLKLSRKAGLPKRSMRGT